MTSIHGVHEHPSYEGWGGSFIKPTDALTPNGLQKTVQRAIELDLGARLQPDLDSIEPNEVRTLDVERKESKSYGCPTSSEVSAA